MTPDEAGARLGMSRYKAIKLFAQQKLLGFSSDKIVRIYADSVDHYLRERINYDPRHHPPDFEPPPHRALDPRSIAERLNKEMAHVLEEDAAEEASVSVAAQGHKRAGRRGNVPSE